MFDFWSDMRDERDATADDLRDVRGTRGVGPLVSRAPLVSRVIPPNRPMSIKQSKAAFTIVELLMVVGIIIVLMGVVTTAAAQSIRASRSRRADALCSLVQAGMNAYYARYDEWPGSIGSRIANGSIGTRSNNEGTQGSNDNDKYELTGTEVRSCVKALVDETKNGTPVMDISGLFVSRFPGELNGAASKGNTAVRKAAGMDFMSAIHGTRSSKKKMTTSEMYFGYPDPSTGYFLRFMMVYSIPTDQFAVSKQR